jgi:L-fuculose-phosphate aldolase
MDIATGKATAGSTLPAEAQLHREIYLKRKDVAAIIASALPYIVDASRELRAVPPLLDDFAQIVGRNALVADPANASQVVRALGKRNAVLLKGAGALCCAESEDEASAVEMVLDKGCRTVLAAAGKDVSSIALSECLLMRYVYKKKYSKLKNTEQ